MAKPPPSGPSSDIGGANQDARAGVPNRDPGKGSAESLEQAEANSAGRPADSGKLAGNDSGGGDE